MIARKALIKDRFLLTGICARSKGAKGNLEMIWVTRSKLT